MSEAHASSSSEVDHAPASVLVVDDNAVNRRKMSLAVVNLGHSVEGASGGAEALAALRKGNFDAVLLDIVMPEVDGYEVLREAKGDPKLRDVPIVVVSALEGEKDSVVEAIELGAEDFLPKDFDFVVLRARLGASLDKKRHRDRELEYLQRVERLTEAAEIVESGSFRPDDLDLDDLTSRDDGLGRLAIVFRGMAEEIYDRELGFTRAIHALRGSLLVIAFGIAWGIQPSLSRMAAGLGSDPITLAIWGNLIAAVVCLGTAAYRRRLTRLTWNEVKFYLALALLVGVLQKLTTYWVTEHIDASLLSILVTLQGIMVFIIAAALGVERATRRRLIGLLVGLGGIGTVLFSRGDMSSESIDIWLFAGLLLPFLLAVETVFLAEKRPSHVDVCASVGYLMSFSLVLLFPMAAADGALGFQVEIGGRLALLVLLLGLAGAASMVLTIMIVDVAGPVFAGQGAYAMTFAGIVWGMLLLDEELSLVAWGAFFVILLGLYLVEPKSSDAVFVLKRSFTDKAQKARA